MAKPQAVAMDALLPPEPLTSADRITVWRQLARVRVREFLQFDSTIAGLLTALAPLGGAAVYSLIGRHRRALDLLTTAHRATTLRLVRAPIERILKRPAPAASRITRRVDAAYDEYLQRISSNQ